MDELLILFIETYFTEEFQEEIIKSFDLFDFYEYNQAYQGFIDIASSQGTISTDDLKDQFVQELNNKLDFVLDQHTIKVTAETTLQQKNQILASLGHLQKLEDYTGIIRMLESFESDEEQLATIISDCTLMDKTEIMTLIVSFSPSILSTLKEYIYQKEEATPKYQSRSDIVSNLKLYSKFTNGNTIGSQLAKNGALLGQRFFEYLPYVEDMFVVQNDHNATALNILSVLYMSIDGFNSPLLVYRKFSYTILQDLNLVSKVEAKLLEGISKYTEFKKAHHESIKLFEIGTTA